MLVQCYWWPTLYLLLNHLYLLLWPWKTLVFDRKWPKNAQKPLFFAYFCLILAKNHHFHSETVKFFAETVKFFEKLLSFCGRSWETVKFFITTSKWHIPDLQRGSIWQVRSHNACSRCIPTAYALLISAYALLYPCSDRENCSKTAKNGHFRPIFAYFRPFLTKNDRFWQETVKFFAETVKFL